MSKKVKLDHQVSHSHLKEHVYDHNKEEKVERKELIDKEQKKEVKKPQHPHEEIKHHWIFRATEVWIAIEVFLAGVIASNILNALLQFKALERLWQQYPLISLFALVLILGTTIPMVLIKIGIIPVPKAHDPIKSEDVITKRNMHHWFFSALIFPTASISLLCLWVFVGLSRPEWCPSIICPTPVVVTQGTYDANLDIYPITLQSPSFVIPRDPTSYNLSNLPEEIGAVSLGRQDSLSSYRVIVGLHSLLQKDTIIIDQIGIIVDQLLPMPAPLNVWTKQSSDIEYSSDPYRAHYQGESAGGILTAVYIPYKDSYLQLAPGEAEQLDIQLVSNLSTNLQYRVQITYHIANSTKRYILLLKNLYQVVFAPIWNQFKLTGNGKFLKNR